MTWAIVPMDWRSARDNKGASPCWPMCPERKARILVNGSDQQPDLRTQEGQAGSYISQCVLQAVFQV